MEASAKRPTQGAADKKKKGCRASCASVVGKAAGCFRVGDPKYFKTYAEFKGWLTGLAVTCEELGASHSPEGVCKALEELEAMSCEVWKARAGELEQKQ